MKIEGIAGMTSPWYVLLLPTVTVYYDKEKVNAGVVVMWLRFIAGLQISFKSNKKD